jgi:hypothetical protein
MKKVLLLIICTLAIGLVQASGNCNKDTAYINSYANNGDFGPMGLTNVTLVHVTTQECQASCQYCDNVHCSYYYEQCGWVPGDPQGIHQGW